MSLEAKGLLATGQAVAVSEHPLCTTIMAEILQRGGNAVDACVAGFAMLGVVQPMMTGWGGEAFLLVYEAASNETFDVAGPCFAPQASADLIETVGEAQLPLDGILSVAVPGALCAVFDSFTRWASGRFAWSELLEPARAVAAGGFTVSSTMTGWIANNAHRLAGYAGAEAVYCPNGEPLQPGATLVQPELAATYRLLAEEGPQALVAGPLTEAIAGYSRSRGGVLTAEDFLAMGSLVRAPLRTTYRGSTLVSHAPPGQGMVLLEALNQAEQAPLASMARDGAEAVLTLLGCSLGAFEDRNRYAGDERFVQVPIERLLSKDHALKRVRDRKGLLPGAGAGIRGGEETDRGGDGDTSALCVRDGEGSCVVAIASLSNIFGSCELVTGTGLLLNNRLGRGFRSDPGHPNGIAPGKYPMSTLHAFMVLDDDSRPVVFGATPGGDSQPQINLQALTALRDWGVAAVDMISLPRWRHRPASDPSSLGSPLTVTVEDGLPGGTIQAIRQAGAEVVVVPWGAQGGSQGGALQIVVQADGDYLALSDPRCDGLAIAL